MKHDNTMSDLETPLAVPALIPKSSAVPFPAEWDDRLTCSRVSKDPC